MTIPAPRQLASTIDSHDNGFNFVRLVCALMVVAYHAWQLNPVAPRPDPLTDLLDPVTNTGKLAVDMFFLISGLFVTQSWLRDPQPLRFAARRIARIVPGLFVCLLVTTVLAVAFFSSPGAPGLASAEAWRYIVGNSVLHFLQYNIPAEELRIAGVLGGMDLNGPLWTLYWEGRMYVMVALVGLAAVLPMREWMRNAAIFLLLAAHLFPTVLSGYVWEVRMWSLFLVGMLLRTVATQVRFGLVHVLCAGALLLLNWTRNASLTESPLSWIGVTLFAATVVLWIGGTRVRALRHFRTHDYSFGIYIWHWPVLLMLRAALPPLDALPLLATALCVIVPVAMLSWHFVEAPAIRTVRRWTRARERARDHAHGRNVHRMAA